MSKVSILFALFLLIFASPIPTRAQLELIEPDPTVHYDTPPDFIQYWSATRLLLTNTNPYSSTEMLEIQQAEFPQISLPTMMWNPPHTLLLFLPFSFLSFSSAFAIWSILGIFIAIAVALLPIECRKLQKAPVIATLLVATNAPLWESLIWGQLGSILTLGVFLTLYGITRRQTVPLILGIILISLKPHLFFFFIPVALYCGYSLFSRKTALIITTVIISVILSPELFFPGVNAHWIKETISNPQGATATSEWKTASLVSAFRILTNDVLGPNSLTAYVFFVALTSLCFSGYLFWARPKIKPVLLEFSLLTSCLLAPYIWLYDFAILIPIQIMLCDRITDARKRSIVATGILSLNIITIMLKSTFLAAQHQYVWYPWILLLLYLCATALTGNENCKSPTKDNRY